jgi:hypothetical protein
MKMIFDGNHAEFNNPVTYASGKTRPTGNILWWRMQLYFRPSGSGPRHDREGDRKPCQATPSLRIRARSVWGLISRSAAAPEGPSIRPSVRARAASMCRAMAIPSGTSGSAVSAGKSDDLAWDGDTAAAGGR